MSGTAVRRKIDKRGKLYKSLLKTAAMVECKSLKSYQLKPWLDEQAALRGCCFDYEASQTIMEYLSVTDNAPLLLLEQEIEKLSVYAGERKIWTKDDIEQTFAALPEVSRFALLNAIAERSWGRLWSFWVKNVSTVILCWRYAAWFRSNCDVLDVSKNFWKEGPRRPRSLQS